LKGFVDEDAQYSRRESANDKCNVERYTIDLALCMSSLSALLILIHEVGVKSVMGPSVINYTVCQVPRSQM
jgi:hypothetical protein